MVVADDQKFFYSSCMVIKTHNFKVFLFVLHDYPPWKIQIIAIPAMAFKPYDFEMLPNFPRGFFLG